MAISYKELADKAGISLPFAAQLLNGAREASLPMAFKIYDATGLQFGILKNLPDETIEHLRPKADEADAA